MLGTVGETTPARIAAAACVALLCGGAPGLAQTVSESATLEEIIVTAQKREQSALEVPVSLVAIPGEALQAGGIESVAGLRDMAAGIETFSENPGIVQINMRGITNLSFGQLDATTAIGYYIDETPLSSFFPSQLPDVGFWNVERVEILRGPQGTLFGEGSMGGTVRVITRRPDPTGFDGSASANVESISGGDSGWGASANLNVPLVDDELAMSLIVTARESGGWIDIPDLGLQDANETDHLGVKVAFGWTPNDRLDIQFSYIDQQTDIATTSGATTQGVYDPQSQGPPGAIAPVSALSPFETGFQLANVTVEYEFERASLISATSWFDFDHTGNLSYDEGSILFFGAPATIWETRDLPSESLTQEFRLVSNSDSKLNWTVGAFFKRNERGGSQAFLFDIPAFMLVDRARQTFDVEIDSYALFGDIEFELTDSWSLQVGGRYYSDDRTVAKEQHEDSVIFGTMAGDAVSESASDSDFAPAVTLSRSGDRSLFYVRAARGFRSGGVNDNQPFAPDEIPPEYGPEELWSYEVGSKNLLRDGRLQLNGYLYMNRWQDIQLEQSTQDELFFYQANAGKAESVGAEVELTVRPTERFTLNANVSFIDSEITESVTNALGDVVIAKGNEIPNTPDTTLSLSADYAMPVFNNLTGRIYGRYAYRASNFSDAQNTQELENDDYNQVFLRFGLEGERWSAFVSGINLLDEDDSVYRTYFLPPILHTTYVQPRTWRLEGTWKF